jgi:hypothetical protein
LVPLVGFGLLIGGHVAGLELSWGEVLVLAM